jgi:hypothetical protein
MLISLYMHTRPLCKPCSLLLPRITAAATTNPPLYPFTCRSYVSDARVRKPRITAATVANPPLHPFTCRSYVSDARVRKQYNQLFSSCDLNNSGYVTYDELKSTLFRFGLADLDAKQPDLLKQMFAEASATHVGRDSATPPDALSPENFETFIQRSVYVKTKFDNALPEGNSPLWWRKCRLELRHYASSFNLLYSQTKSAGRVVLNHGWRMKKEERKMVQVAVFDFLKTLPFAALLVAPMGSLMVPIVMKVFPSLLPSAFYTTNPEDWHSKDRADKLAITSLEVATRILRLEKRLREVKKEWE